MCDRQGSSGLNLCHIHPRGFLPVSRLYTPLDFLQYSRAGGSMLQKKRSFECGGLELGLF